MILSHRRKLLMAVFMTAASLAVDAFAPPSFVVGAKPGSSTATAFDRPTFLSTASGDSPEPALKKAPVLNGKMLLPLKVMVAGLKGHEVAAVYAIKNSDYKRGSGDGWQHCEYVGVTRNLDATLQSHLKEHGADTVSHVRALSFAYPQERAMEEVASKWRKLAVDAGGKAGDESGSNWADSWGSLVDQRREELVDLMERTAFYDDEDDEDDFDDDEDEITMGEVSQSLGKTQPAEADQTVVSPFESASKAATGATETKLEFNRENVDKVLEEVRPYLIADAGNVAVESVDEETRNVYLILEGACGSCSSSTVTMQMGIERVLKENFADLGEVVQVEDPAAVAAQPTELTWEAVEEEASRLMPAISAMGGVMEIVSVDPMGVVEIKFQGANKVRQGLELAIRDVPLVKHVNFVMGQ